MIMKKYILDFKSFINEMSNYPKEEDNQKNYERVYNNVESVIDNIIYSLNNNPEFKVFKSQYDEYFDNEENDTSDFKNIKKLYDLSKIIIKNDFSSKEEINDFDNLAKKLFLTSVYKQIEKDNKSSEILDWCLENWFDTWIIYAINDGEFDMPNNIDDIVNDYYNDSIQENLITEKIKTLDVIVSIFGDGQFIGAYSSKEKFEKELKNWENNDYVIVKGSPFHIENIQRPEIFVIFETLNDFTEFQDEYKILYATDIFEARNLSKKHHTKNSYLIYLDKAAKTNFLPKMKNIFELKTEKEKYEKKYKSIKRMTDYDDSEYSKPSHKIDY